MARVLFGSDGATIVYGDAPDQRVLLSEQEILFLWGLSKRWDQREEALQRIVQWSEAYPVDIFPEPSSDEWKKAAAALQAIGLSLDRLSASCMRHVIDGVGKIAREALQ